MCASCKCGCKPGKPAKGCDCQCKDCRTAREGVSKSGRLVLVEKGYTKEDALRSAALAPTVAGGLVGANALQDVEMARGIKRSATNGINRDARSRFARAEANRRALDAAKVSRLRRRASGKAGIAAGLIGAGALMTVPAHRQEKIGKSLVELSKSAKAGWEVEKGMNPFKAFRAGRSIKTPALALNDPFASASLPSSLSKPVKRRIRPAAAAVSRDVSSLTEMDRVKQSGEVARQASLRRAGGRVNKPANPFDMVKSDEVIEKGLLNGAKILFTGRPTKKVAAQNIARTRARMASQDAAWAVENDAMRARQKVNHAEFVRQRADEKATRIAQSRAGRY